MKFTLKTNHPVALDSLDHIHAYGAASNNSRCTVFNEKLHAWFKSANASVLDLGCSGGGMVHDLLEMGFVAVGLEGSDYSLKTKRAEWPLIPDNLFTCDVTKPFTLSMHTEPHPFDVVTAWEFWEHIKEADLSGVFENINQHSRKGSHLICSISCSSSLHNGIEFHQTMRPSEWWLNIFNHFGWKVDPAMTSHFGGHFVRLGDHNIVVKRI